MKTQNAKIEIMKAKISIFLILQFSIFLNAQPQPEYVPGDVLVTVPDGYFNFPLEVYGAFISYSVSDEEIVVHIDSVKYQTFLPNSRVKEREEVISANIFLKKHETIHKQIEINISDDMIKVFYQFKVHYIQRIAEGFSPQDTISKNIRSPLTGEMKLNKRSNWNNHLLIKFSPEIDFRNVVNALKPLPDVKYVSGNEIAHVF